MFSSSFLTSEHTRLIAPFMPSRIRQSTDVYDRENKGEIVWNGAISKLSKYFHPFLGQKNMDGVGEIRI